MAVSVSGYTEIAEKAYDFNVIDKNADMVNVMAYDYHGYWDGVTSHHSPLKKLPNSKNTYFVVSFIHNSMFITLLVLINNIDFFYYSSGICNGILCQKRNFQTKT